MPIRAGVCPGTSRHLPGFLTTSAGHGVPGLFFRENKVFVLSCQCPLVDSHMKALTWLPQSLATATAGWEGGGAASPSPEKIRGSILHRPRFKGFAPKVLQLVVGGARQRKEPHLRV